MPIRPSAQPAVSIVIACHNCQDTLSRVVESVLRAETHSIQLLLVDCRSGDRTLSIARSFEDLDIRVDVLECDTKDLYEGAGFGISHARGSYISLLDARDWFSPESLDTLVSYVGTHRSSLICPNRSIDIDLGTGEVKSDKTSYAAFGADDFHSLSRALPMMLSDGMFASVSGWLIDRDLFDGMDENLAERLQFESVFLLDCLKRSRSLAVVPLACCHVHGDYLADRYSEKVYQSFDGECSALSDLASAWKLTGDSDFARAMAHRIFDLAVFGIENLSLSPKSVGANERNARIRALLMNENVVSALEVLKPRARGLAPLYVPMRKGNVAVCCMTSWMLNLLSPITHVCCLYS